MTDRDLLPEILRDREKPIIRPQSFFRKESDFLPEMSEKEIEAARKIMGVMDISDLTPWEKAEFLKEARRKAKKDRVKHEKEAAKIEQNQAALKNQLDLLNEVITWMEGHLEIQPAKSSVLHKVLDAQENKRLFRYGRDEKKVFTFTKTELDKAVPIVVSRSYAHLLENTEAEAGDFQPPYDICAFQFRLTGRDVIFLTCACDDGRVEAVVLYGVQDAWFMSPTKYEYADGNWHSFEDPSQDKDGDLHKVLGNEARAISIMLEAEVAETKVIRAPSRLNSQREKRGKLPIHDYHVIDLRNRKRYEPGPGIATGTTRRLHFRRGHWRHYEGFKTWIRWCVAGDPSKGWIESEYKL